MDEDLFDDDAMLRNLARGRHKIITSNLGSFLRDLEAHAALLERAGIIPDAQSEPIAEGATVMLEWVRDIQERLKQRGGW